MELVGKGKLYLTGTERIENIKDPSKPYLRVSIGGEEGNPDTFGVANEEVFNKIASMRRFQEINVVFEYIQTPKFSMFRIKDVIDAPERVNK